MFYDYYETQLEKSNVIREVKREVQKKNRLRKFKADTIFQNLFLSATDFWEAETFIDILKTQFLVYMELH